MIIFQLQPPLCSVPHNIFLKYPEISWNFISLLSDLTSFYNSNLGPTLLVIAAVVAVDIILTVFVFGNRQRSLRRKSKLAKKYHFFARDRDGTGFSPKPEKPGPY